MARGSSNFRPGKEKRYTEEKMSNERQAWLKTFIAQYILRIEPRPEDDPSLYGDVVSIVIPRPRSAVVLNLTSLTGEELRMTRQFFNVAFDIAEKLCDERDKVAQDAWDSGDDSHIRVYRSVPELVVRSGASGEYGEMLRERLANDATRSRPGGSTLERIRELGDEVVDEHTGGSSPEDDMSQANSSEGVREVGRDGEHSGDVLSADSIEGDSPPLAGRDGGGS